MRLKNLNWFYLQLTGYAGFDARNYFKCLLYFLSSSDRKLFLCYEYPIYSLMTMQGAAPSFLFLNTDM